MEQTAKIHFSVALYRSDPLIVISCIWEVAFVMLHRLNGVRRDDGFRGRNINCNAKKNYLEKKSSKFRCQIYLKNVLKKATQSPYFSNQYNS